MTLRLLLLALTLQLGSGALLAADSIGQCDRLASHPEDPDKVAPGVERKDMDINAAIAACNAEVKAHPDNARARYQLARALFYGKQNQRAITEMRKAADGGYPQAQFVYGLFVSNARDGAPTDFCLVEQYWLKAARGGRQAARVAYVRDVLRGSFHGCKIEATHQEMTSLLATAAREAQDFYEKLLIEDLTAELAASATGPAAATPSH
ncbi:MAG: hypothetical protein R3F24_03665 [Gammaproteobacteria bacterium]